MSINFYGVQRGAGSFLRGNRLLKSLNLENLSKELKIIKPTVKFRIV